MRALLAAAALATAVVGTLTVSTSGTTSHRADIGPVPVPTMVCAGATYQGVERYLCLNYPALPSV